MTPREKILEKARKLKALSIDKGLTTEEAATYVEKVAAICAEHLIDEADLAVGEKSKTVEQNMMIEDITDWQILMCQAIAERLGCLIITYGSTRDIICLTGKPLIVESAYNMIERLNTEIYELAMKQFPGMLYSMERCAKGIGMNIVFRILQMQREGGLLPVVQERKDLEAEILKDPNIKINPLSDKVDKMDIRIDSPESFLGDLIGQSIDINKSVK